MYIVKTVVVGFDYYLKFLPETMHRPYSQWKFKLEGLKNNATTFTKAKAEEVANFVPNVLAEAVAFNQKTV